LVPTSMQRILMDVKQVKPMVLITLCLISKIMLFLERKNRSGVISFIWSELISQ
jgi:hypothetical protein